MNFTNIKKRTIGDYTVIQTSGELSLYNITDVRNALLDSITAENRKIIIDLKNSHFIDSTFVGVLVLALKKIRLLQGELCLMNMSDDVGNTLRLAYLLKEFIVFENESEIPVS